MSTAVLLSSISLFFSLEKSRMSFTRLERRRPLEAIMNRLRFIVSLTSPAAPSRRDSARPTIPLMGVRSSCEVLARNSSLNASILCSSLLVSSSSVILRSRLNAILLNASESRPSSSLDFTSTLLVRLPASIFFTPSITEWIRLETRSLKMYPNRTNIPMNITDAIKMTSLSSTIGS